MLELGELAAVCATLAPAQVVAVANLSTAQQALAVAAMEPVE